MIIVVLKATDDNSKAGGFDVLSCTLTTHKCSASLYGLTYVTLNTCTIHKLLELYITIN